MIEIVLSCFPLGWEVFGEIKKGQEKEVEKHKKFCSFYSGSR